MPNLEARVFRSIWDDRDFLALPMDAKTFFFTVLTGWGINHAGIVQIPRREWVNLHPDEDTTERLLHARKLCEEARFLFIDDDTDEILVRSYIRRDIANGPPATFRAGMDAAAAARSPRLREILRTELLRLDPSQIEAKKAESSTREAPIVAYRRALTALGGSESRSASRTATAESERGLWDDAQSERDPIESSERATSSTSSAMGSKDGSAATRAARSGDGAGDGARESCSVGDQVGGSRAPADTHAHAGAREAPPTPTHTEIDQTPASGRRVSKRLRALYEDLDNDAPCHTHPDDDRPCRRCGDIRERRPDGYDPRPPDLIPDDELRVDAWAGRPQTISAPIEVEDGDPADRQRWYRDAATAQRAERIAEARRRLGDYQAANP